MKVAFIGCSNLKFMPYLNSYLELIPSKYLDVIFWDRFNMLEYIDNTQYIYKDKKNGHKRSTIDYFKFSKFVKAIVEKNNYDLLIISTIQLYFFMHKYLEKNWNKKFILDIRDYHKLFKFLNKEKLYSSSKYIVVSSVKYKDFLVGSNNVLVNHNVTFVENKLEIEDIEFNNEISINSIGATRDIEANKLLMDSFSGSSNYILSFHGEGIANKELMAYVEEKNISNVTFTGLYNPEELPTIYKKSVFINVVRFNDSFNNYAALPNRLYQAVLYGRPLLAFEGTYLSQIIDRYGLGIVLNSKGDQKRQLEEYIKKFDAKSFQLSRKIFLDDVNRENDFFKKNITSILKR